MERLRIEDKFDVLRYDINVNLAHLFVGKIEMELNKGILTVKGTNEEDIMHIIRFCVVNGRSFSYKFGV